MKNLVTVLFLFALCQPLFSQKVSNFSLKDTENQYRTFNELKGEKLTAIDFWATWCKPCNKAIPELNKIYESYRGKGLNIIGINCDGPRSLSKVAPLVSVLQVKYPILIDIDSKVMKDLNLSAFPTLVLVNASGKVVWVHEGFLEGDEKLIISAIDRNLTPVVQ